MGKSEKKKFNLKSVLPLYIDTKMKKIIKLFKCKGKIKKQKFNLKRCILVFHLIFVYFFVHLIFVVIPQKRQS